MTTNEIVSFFPPNFMVQFPMKSFKRRLPEMGRKKAHVWRPMSAPPCEMALGLKSFLALKGEESAAKFANPYAGGVAKDDGERFLR